MRFIFDVPRDRAWDFFKLVNKFSKGYNFINWGTERNTIFGEVVIRPIFVRLVKRLAKSKKLDTYIWEAE